MRPFVERTVLPRRRSLLGLAGLLAWVPAARAAAGADEPAAAARTAQARLKLARAALEAVRANLARGQFNPGERDPIYIWSRRRFEARIDLSPAKAERIAAAQEHVDEMKAALDLINRVHAAGDVDRLAQMDAEYRLLEAESWLDRERAAKA